jgi:hypothetical protein
MTDYFEKSAMTYLVGFVALIGLISFFVYSQDHNPLGPALLPLEFLAMTVFGAGFVAMLPKRR